MPFLAVRDVPFRGHSLSISMGRYDCPDRHSSTTHIVPVPEIPLI